MLRMGSLVSTMEHIITGASDVFTTGLALASLLAAVEVTGLVFAEAAAAGAAVAAGGAGDLDVGADDLEADGPSSNFSSFIT